MYNFTLAINFLLGVSAFAALVLVRERLRAKFVLRAVVVSRPRPHRRDS